jgi:hypothetical protein
VIFLPIWNVWTKKNLATLVVAKQNIIFKSFFFKLKTVLTFFRRQAHNQLLAEKKEANAKKTEERRQRHLQEQARLVHESRVSEHGCQMVYFQNKNPKSKKPNVHTGEIRTHDVLIRYRRK